jgi:hypothetical protein
MLATKAALSIRLDALNDADTRSAPDAPSIGIEARAKLESRLQQLEQGLGITSVRRADKGDRGNQKRFEMKGNGATYNPAADSLVPTAAKAAPSGAGEVDSDDEVYLRFFFLCIFSVFADARYRRLQGRRPRRRRKRRSEESRTRTATLTLILLWQWMGKKR